MHKHTRTAELNVTMPLHLATEATPRSHTSTFWFNTIAFSRNSTSLFVLCAFHK